MKLAELASQYFPPGVVQALSGNDSLGPWLTAHPGVDKISFTGSTATGKKVLASAAPTLKRVTLELGGNDPSIICEDVDVKEVAPKIAFAAVMNSGQVSYGCAFKLNSAYEENSSAWPSSEFTSMSRSLTSL